MLDKVVVMEREMAVECFKLVENFVELCGFHGGRVGLEIFIGFWFVLSGSGGESRLSGRFCVVDWVAGDD